MKKIDILKEMTRVIDVEIEALQSVRDNMGPRFEAAVRLIAGQKGRSSLRVSVNRESSPTRSPQHFGALEPRLSSFMPAKRFTVTSVRSDVTT